MITTYRRLTLALLVLVVTLAANLTTGPVSAQISGGNARLAANNSFSGTQTFVNVTVTGVCTGCVAAASTLTGTTLASNVVTSSLTSVGTLVGGATGAGFTVALSTSTITGSLADARLSSNVMLLNGGQTVSSVGPITSVGLITAADFKSSSATLAGPQAAGSANAGQERLILYADANNRQVIGVGSDGGLWISSARSSGTGVQIYTGATPTQNVEVAADGSITFAGVAGTGTIADVVCMTSGGTLIKSAAATCVISSERYKHDIQPLEGSALEFLAHVQPVTYYLNDHEDRGHLLGAIAERVHEIPHESLWPKDLSFVNRQDDGQIVSLQYEALTVMAVRAIQEQQAEIRELRRLLEDGNRQR